eukprot:g1446.t1
MSLRRQSSIKFLFGVFWFSFGFLSHGVESKKALPVPCDEFYVPCNMSYHNVATLGIVPKQVLQKTRDEMDVLQTLTANEYFGMNLGTEIFPEPSFLTRMENVRDLVSKFIGCFKNETVLFPSTTLALNAIATGLVESKFLKHGDEILTTDQEHAGGIAGWVHYSSGQYKDFLTLNRIPLPIPDTRSISEIVDDFEQYLVKKFPRTKVLAISHVSTTTGAALPIKEITAMAHLHGVSVVIDGAQAFGMHVNVTDLGVDAYATSAHKWILAPTGNGILFVKSKFQKHIYATVLDGGAEVYTRTVGTRPAHSIIGLGHAINFWHRYGRDEIVKFNLRLAKSAWQQLKKDATFIMLSRCPDESKPSESAPIVSITWKNSSKTAVEVGKKAFDKYGLVVKMTGRTQFPGEWPPTGPSEALRITFHMFNTDDDVKKLVASLSQILNE